MCEELYVCVGIYMCVLSVRSWNHVNATSVENYAPLSGLISIKKDVTNKY